MPTLKLTKKYSTYPEYRDSGVEWIGEIPENWRTIRAKNLFKKMNRLPDQNDDIVTAFRDGTVTLRKNRREDGFTMADKEIGYQKIKKGDLIIHGMDAFAGAIGVSDSEGKASPVYSACVPIRGSVPFFHSYLLRHMSKSKYIFALAKGIRERSTEFRFKEFGNLVVAEPSSEDQQKIANYLDEKTAMIDQIIEKKLRQIELLREKRTAVINQAVTRGLDPDVELVESGIEWIGKIPKGWKVRRIKDISSYCSRGASPEYTEDENGYKFINQSCIRDGFLDLKKVKYSSSSSKKGLVKNHDILVNSTGTGTLGRLSVFDSDIKCFADTHVTILRPDKANSYFIMYLLQNPAWQNYLYASSVTGSTNQIELSRNRFLEIPLTLPPELIQKEIVMYLNEKVKNFSQALKSIENSIIVLQEFKSSLISHVVTGKIKI